MLQKQVNFQIFDREPLDSQIFSVDALTLSTSRSEIRFLKIRQNTVEYQDRMLQVASDPESQVYYDADPNIAKYSVKGITLPNGAQFLYNAQFELSD